MLAVLSVALAATTGLAGDRKAIAPIVVPVGPTMPTGELIANLASADPAVRASAAWQLSGTTDLKARLALDPLRDDSDKAVRYATAWALAHLAPGGTATARTPDYTTPPKPLHIMRPQYPSSAFDKWIQGNVVVEILIGEEGEVAHVVILKSIAGLDAAAVACVRQWKFEAARLNGKARPTVAQAPISFRRYE